MAVPRLAIVSTHPIQYYAPVFRALTTERLVEPRVFYTWSQTEHGAVYDPGFGCRIAWDVPLLDGYASEFVPNVAARPGIGFLGIRTPSLPARIAAWQADAILVYGWNNASHLGVMRHFKGRVPVLFRGDSTLLDPQPAWRQLARLALLRGVYRYVDAAIAVGENSRDYFRAAGVPEDRIAIAPHSVDNERFADRDGAAARHAADWRRALGIEPDAVVLGFAGKLLPKKAPELLLEAFLAAGAPGHLVLTGDGVLDGALRDRAAGRRNVHFLPFQNQSLMPSVYRICDLFILPSRGPGETWGLALNEAMASGRAVAATARVGGARDLIRQDIDGWVVAPDSSAALCRLIERAATAGRARLAAMGEGAQRRIAAWSTAESARRIAAAVVELALPARAA